MEIYHYARVNQISRTPENALYVPPYSVSHRTGSEVRGIYALLEPAPLNWVTNTDFDEYSGKIWQELIGHLKVDPVLFAINVDEIAASHLTVFDYGHLKGGKVTQVISRVISGIESKNPDYSFLSPDYYYSRLERIPEKYRHLDPETEGRRLLETAVSLEEYLANKNTLMFSLPEIFISTPLAPTRFKIAKEQPILESLYCKDAPARDYNIALLVFRIPELREWAESFLYDGSYSFSSDLIGFRNSLDHIQRYGIYVSNLF